jgi:hypothetical protein
MTQKMKKVSMILWVIAALMYVGGFLALASGSEFLSVNWQTWFWNALVLGVLVLGVKLGVLIMMKEEKKM